MAMFSSSGECGEGIGLRECGEERIVEVMGLICCKGVAVSAVRTDGWQECDF